jgi:hypothetical protein
MAELERAIQALKNAHAAGDTAAAKQIANAIKGMQVPKARTEITDTAGMAAHATGGVLMGFGDEYMAGLSAVLGVQPDGNGGANWFDYSKPIGERYSTALGAIRSEMDEYQDESPIKAGGAQIAGAVGTGVGVGAKLGVKAAQTTAGRAGQMVRGGAVAGAVEGFGAGEGGLANRARSSAVGGLAGAVFAPVVGFGMAKVAKEAERIGGKALSRIFTNRQMVNAETGELTERGRTHITALGFDPEKLSAEMQRSFGRAAERIEMSVDEPLRAAAVQRAAQADRFGVPLTRGQTTGEVSQIANEMSMRAGVRGEGASRTLEGFDNVQRGVVDDARENIGDRLGNATGRIDAADSVITGVRREAEVARQAGSQAYDALSASGAALDGRAFTPLRGQIESAVRAEGFAIDQATPNTRAALGVLENAFGGSKGGAVPFENIERARQRLNGLRQAAYKGDNGADQVAIDKTIEQFDGWLDDTITDALISGDEAVLGQAKEARRLWSKYRQTFLSKDGADNFIRKIVQDDLAPDQVAGWLFGGARNIGGGQTSLVAKRVKGILGPESEEWGAVRRAAWDHITKNTEGKDPYGPQQIASNISDLLEGKGKTLGAELFDERERQVMAEFRDMLKVLVPPKMATNPSGSGYQVERGMQMILQGMAGMMGGAAAGPVGAAASAGAVRTGSNFSGTLAARAAARGITVPPPSVPGAVGAGVGASGAAQDQTFR